MTTPESVLKVFNIFKDFYKEGFVDLQQNSDQLTWFILVYFPYVTITNEYDKSVDIKDLYAKVVIDTDGKMVGKFALNRATYTALHIANNYMHSHVSRIPVDNFREFQIPCTGSGPINNTILTLNHHYDDDMWALFCLELSKYVTVESIEGVPYHRLESLGANQSVGVNIDIEKQGRISGRWDMEWIPKFIYHIIKNKLLKFNYIDGCYSIAMSEFDLTILLSSEFIKWVNEGHMPRSCHRTEEDLLGNGVLTKRVIADGKIWSINSSSTLSRLHTYIGRPVCTFKGKPICISVEGSIELTEHTALILNRNYISFIITFILKVVNYIYGNSNTERPKLSEKVQYV